MAMPLMGKSAVEQGAQIELVLSPSSLGLRPLADRAEPGAWRAPEVLMAAGLGKALGVRAFHTVPKPAYSPDAESGTRIRNGHAIRAHALHLARTVETALRQHRFPVVIGGDCSILLGCLYGQRRAGGKGLVHVDGHSDFYHPGNYDASARLGSVAGMDLALATGRGERLLTTWPDMPPPLVADADAIQVGDRDTNAPDYDYADIAHTQISRLSIEEVLSEGMLPTVSKVVDRLGDRGLNRAWLHVDLDILDERIMPAVDSPGRPGLDFEQLATLVRGIVSSGRIAGVDFTIYDPLRDPSCEYAAPIVACIAEGLSTLVVQHDR